MFDPNILAILIPVDTQDLARNSFALDANAHCYHNPANAITEEPANWSRETTPAPQRSAERTYDSVAHIIIKFSNKPKDASRGWLLGTDPRRADFLLRGTKKGVSRHHLYVTVNERLYVEAHDNSTFGAAVGYDGKAKDEARKKDRWIISLEPGRRRKWNDITIYLPNEDGLAFRIEFPNHEAGHPEYVANLQAFLHESQAALPPVGALGLNNIPATVAPSQVHTPRYRSIYLDDGLIGRGAFGEVRKMIETRTGDVYAAKKFHKPTQTRNSSRKRKLDKDEDDEFWLRKIRKEIAIMRENPHPNVMEVINFHETPEPVLFMRYYHLGNLEELEGVTQEQSLSAFRQVLLGLDHLHERLIVHRDLKPENLIVAALEPFMIKIADFGLSKDVAESFVKTFCGSALYVAPEVFNGGLDKRHDHNSDRYGSPADIWSTGVIFLMIIYDPPAIPNMPGIEMWDTRLWKYWFDKWTPALVERVNDFENDKLADILSRMVTIDPKQRLTAKQCLERGCRTGLFKRRQNGIIVDAGDGADDEATVRVQTLVL